MKEVVLSTIEDLEQFINHHHAAAIYFSRVNCGVCKSLKPQLILMLSRSFPKIDFAYIDVEKSNFLAAQNSIFSVPTILLYFNQKEFLRVSRNISLIELKETLSRPYDILFS